MLDEEDVLDVRLLFSPKHARPVRAEVLAVKEGLARWCAARGSAAALAPSEWAIFQRPFGAILGQLPFFNALWIYFGTRSFFNALSDLFWDTFFNALSELFWDTFSAPRRPANGRGG